MAHFNNEKHSTLAYKQTRGEGRLNLVITECVCLVILFLLY